MIQSTYALPENQSLLSYAQDYLQRGLCVIPVRPDSKAALVRWQRYQKQRPSESSVRNWFSRWPDARIGVVFGAVSHGLGSRDFDDAASYEEWRAEHRDVAETLPTSATARGYHVFFRLLPDMARETRARLGRGTNGAVTLQRDGHSLGELRFDCGCFSVLPPSSHPSGKYEWIVPLPQDLQNVPCVDIFRTQIVPPYSFATLHSTHSHTCITSNTCHVIGFAEESCAAVLRGCGDVAGVAERVASAIARTIPTCLAMRNNRIFQFAREVKAIPELALLDPRRLTPIVRDWHAAALPIIGTKPFEITLADFRRAWSAVKFPANCEPIQGIWRDAMQKPLPACADGYEPSTQWLIALCAELQRLAGNKPFYLSCRAAGSLLNVSHTEANSLIWLLCDDRVLRRVRSGKFRERSSEFRYLGDIP